MSRKELRTEEDWEKIESNLQMDKFEYPKLREEYENYNSFITARCLKHDCVYTSKYYVHTRKNSISKGCPICKQEIKYRRFIEALKKSNPNYEVSFEDFCNSELVGGGHHRYRVFCKKHNIYFTTNSSMILSGNGSCPECKKEMWSSPRIERTPELIEELIQLANEGYGYVTISKKLGIGERTAKRIYEEELKLGELPRDKKYRERNKNWTDVLNEYTSIGYSVKEISDITKIPYDPLLSFSIRHNIPHITYKVPEWHNILTREYIEKRLIEDKISVEDLGREFNIEGYVIRQHMENIGAKSSSEINTMFREELASDIKFFSDKGIDWKDICDELEISRYLINKIAEEYNITLNKTGCSSNGERIIKNYLTSINIDFRYNNRNPDIIGRSNCENSRGVFIDFCFSHNSRFYYIEFHGQQHFRYDRFFHRENYSNFQSQVRRDRNVRKYCEEYEITLIEIPIFDYNTTTSIEYLLNKVLIEGVNPEDIINIESYYERPINEILNNQNQ